MQTLKIIYLLLKLKKQSGQLTRRDFIKSALSLVVL